jgi:hypothetical protein
VVAELVDAGVDVGLTSGIDRLLWLIDRNGQFDCAGRRSRHAGQGVRPPGVDVDPTIVPAIQLVHATIDVSGELPPKRFA